MEKAFRVGLGGFLGSIGRYTLSGWVHRVWPSTMFPAGTLSVNLVGCCLIGLLAAGVGSAIGRGLWGAS